MRFIGDVHGKFDRYHEIIANCNESIQVGDFGIGFADPGVFDDDHTFIRGNHDNPDMCKMHPNWTPDGYYTNKYFFVGGAESVDKMRRIPGVSWWHDEELSINDMCNIIPHYEYAKPEFMVTHDCPDIVANEICGYQEDSTRTRYFLSVLLEIHKPRYWIFGHWHVSFQKEIHGTKFICLNELEYVDIT